MLVVLFSFFILFYSLLSALMAGCCLVAARGLLNFYRNAGIPVGTGWDESHSSGIGMGQEFFFTLYFCGKGQE